MICLVLRLGVSTGGGGFGSPRFTAGTLLLEFNSLALKAYAGNLSLLK
jgi:hypothetical protein